MDVFTRDFMVSALSAAALLLSVLPSPALADESGAKQPYTLGASKIRILTEEEQRLHRPDAMPPLAPQLPFKDSLTGGVKSNVVPLHAENNAIEAFQQAPGTLQLQTGKADSTILPGKVATTTLPGKATSTVRLLADYDVELIVDSSMSMRRHDCPGGLSRWNWCGVQARELSRQLVPYVPRGLTITAFASNYDVYHNSSPGNIADLFENPNFRGGTRLAEPLADRLNEFFVRRQPGSKPLLIAVITDGVPHPAWEPMMVATTLVNASRRMKDPHEVTVVFFQIGGNDQAGEAFLNFLDYGLLEKGARYDFVKTVPFDHLMNVGLSQALVESIQQFAKRNSTAAAK
ncbi:MAG: hypothetical protein U0105_17255 [Candidatus Obscuribacterales bacterium]